MKKRLPRYGFLRGNKKKAYDFCFMVHDEMVMIIQSGEKTIFQHQITPVDGKRIPTDCTGEALLSWLSNNGYEKDVALILYKQSIIALLSDCLHFFHESLQNLKKSKISVAYSLLRKPLKENLFYMEWMLAEPEEYFKYMFNEELSIPAVEHFSPEKKLKIIEQACEKVGGTPLMPPKLMYDIRYNKDCYYGIEPLCQKATHLITTFRNYKTAPQNFNFIFSNPQNIEEQLVYAFNVLPFFLVHTLQVVNRLISDFSEWDDPSYVSKTELRILFGLLLLKKDSDPSVRSMLNAMIKKMNKSNLHCTGCNEKIRFNQTILEMMSIGGIIECKKCGELISIYDISEDS